MHEFFVALIQKYHTARESIIYENIISEVKNILSIGRHEYIEHPPSKYLREGEKLLARLENYTHENFLFLRNADVPYTNNISERLLRNIKGIL